MTKKKILVVAIVICVVEFILFSIIQIIVGDISYLFETDKNMVQIVAGMDAIIYYLSPESHTIEIYKGHVDDYYDLFDHWRCMSGLSEEVVLNFIDINSGYETEVDCGGSNVLQYTPTGPIIECDLSAMIYSQSNFEALIDTWSKTIQGQWEGGVAKLTITVNGNIVYIKT